VTIAIFHISDLHFSREPLPPLTRGTSAVGHRVRFGIPGQLPHDPNVLDDLERSIERLIQQHRPGANRGWDKRILVVSGDLTVCGDDSEFSVALTAIQGTLAIDATKAIALGRLFDDLLLVPGNHDHWKARALSAWAFQHGHSPIHGKYFLGDPPSQTHWYRGISGGGVHLQIAGVDSSSASGLNLLARGQLPQGWDYALLQSFNNDPNRRGGRVARFLVTHHSLDHQPGFNGAAHRFRSSDERDLLQFAQSAGLHVVLTGHLHEPHVTSQDIEMRCGTTLQGTLFGRMPARHGWTYLLHELEPTAGNNVQLTTTIYARTPKTAGFHPSLVVTRILRP
jgi:hypothetical protein